MTEKLHSDNNADRIFIHNFPDVGSNEELQKCIRENPKLDFQYVSAGCIKERAETKEWLESIYNQYKPFAEPKFLKRLRQPGHFHSLSWQMYLGSVLLDKGYKLKKVAAKGPDLCVELNKRKIWIEATTTNPGDDTKAMGLPKSGSIYESLDPRVARITYSLMEKYKKYKKDYLEKTCKADEPFIIAINANNTDTRMGPRAIEAAVFARGNDVFVKDENDQLVGGYFEPRPEILVNKDGKDIIVSTTYFCSAEYKEISAVIYCEEHIINANNFGRVPEGNLYMAINKFATNKIPDLRVGHLSEGFLSIKRTPYNKKN